MWRGAGGRGGVGCGQCGGRDRVALRGMQEEEGKCDVARARGNESLQGTVIPDNPLCRHLARNMLLAVLPPLC